jgi:CubicO group peptidase (beta-lactamase class C family)
MLKKILLGLVVLLSISIIALMTPPFAHIRNFIKWKEHSIFDYRTHPSRNVENGNLTQLWPFDNDYNKKSISDSLLSKIDNNNTHAFLVFQDGNLLYEKYWDSYSKDSISGSFSAAKSIISMLIGIAIEEGKIKNIEEPAGNYLDHFKKGDLSKIKIKDLLTMSSGTNYLEKDKGYFSLNAKAYYGDDMEELVSEMNAKESPGKNWEYRSGDTQVLGLIVEKVYKKSISELVSEKFMIPMGAENDAKWLLDGKEKHEKAFCCFNAVARDYARFGELMLTNGKWKGKQLVPENYMKAALQPASYLKDPTENNKPVDFYGYQFWIVNHKGLKVPSMNGLFGQYVYAIKEKNMIIVRLGETMPVTPIHHYQPENFLYIDAGLSLAK